MMLRALYTLLLCLGLPLIAIRLWLRSRREPGYSKRVGERFGLYAIAARAPVLWVHAVSVGEVRASVPLVTSLRAQHPDHTLLVTCMTAAGRDAIGQAFGSTVVGAFLPYDYPFAVRRFLDHFRPHLCVLIETEIWINMLAECRHRALPVVLASARMSPGSCRGYRRLSMLTRPAFEGFAAVCAQSEADADRIASLGAHRVKVAGNLKFDFEPDPGLLKVGADLKRSFGGRRALLLASTREGEEALLLEALKGRLTEDTLLVLVPRHPQRFDAVAAVIGAAGLTYVRRSSGGAVGDARVLLGDSMGEMPSYYAAADVAMIGGSLLPFGGQNLIEACAIGVPVIVGPHVYNFSEAVRLAVESGAAIQADNAHAVADCAIALLGDPARRRAMGSAGTALCRLHRGSTEAHLEVIEALMRR